AQASGLLWGDLMVSLLLGIAERPNPREIAVRARDAAVAFLQLHPLPKEHAPIDVRAPGSIPSKIQKSANGKLAIQTRISNRT
ncbi:MAG TPA: hypothetical protein VGV15_14265, partial [Terriglobales bacterium]|nr:hypothetical protein [Terriglobales bacterium]